MQRTIAAVVLLALCAASVTAAPRQKPVSNEPPRSWDLDEIARETPTFAGGRVYVLAWTIMEDEDDRRLRVESCLVMRVLDKKEGYCLAHLYRHPNNKKPQWELSMTHVMGAKGTKDYPGQWYIHTKCFEKRPGNKEVYGSLSFEEVDWTFECEKGCKLVDCGVCEKTWREVIGERPTRFFRR